MVLHQECYFENKVRYAQKAGFKSAIVYDDDDYDILVAKFHAFCVDSWLTTWRTFCPLCKRDARKSSTGDPPALENTRLLSSTSGSFRSSSSAIQIGLPISQSPYVSHVHSVASTLCFEDSFRSIQQQPPSLSVSRSSLDLRNASLSIGYPSLSLLNSRYLSPNIPSPSNASPFLLSSSSHQLIPLHYSESAASFSPFSSTRSLPEC